MISRLQQPFPGLPRFSGRRRGREGQGREPLCPVRCCTRALCGLGRARAHPAGTPPGRAASEPWHGPAADPALGGRSIPLRFYFSRLPALRRDFPLRAYCARTPGSLHAGGALGAPPRQLGPCLPNPPARFPRGRRPGWDQAVCLLTASGISSGMPSCLAIGVSPSSTQPLSSVTCRRRLFLRGAGSPRFVCQQLGGEYL